MQKLRFILLSLVFILGLTACTPYYTLPKAPAQEEWVAYEDRLPENEEEKVQREIESKRAAIKLYAALVGKEYAEAIDFMTQDTVAFLEAAADGRGAAAALEFGKIYKNGEEQEFNPVDAFFIENLSDLRDDFGTVEQNENKKRKELFAVNGDGQARRVVMILENDRWKFHSTSIDSTTLKE